MLFSTIFYNGSRQTWNKTITYIHYYVGLGCPDRYNPHCRGSVTRNARLLTAKHVLRHPRQEGLYTASSTFQGKWLITGQGVLSEENFKRHSLASSSCWDCPYPVKGQTAICIVWKKIEGYVRRIYVQMLYLIRNQNNMSENKSPLIADRPIVLHTINTLRKWSHKSAPQEGKPSRSKSGYASAWSLEKLTTLSIV